MHLLQIIIFLNQRKQSFPSEARQPLFFAFEQNVTSTDLSPFPSGNETKFSILCQSGRRRLVEPRAAAADAFVNGWLHRSVAIISCIMNDSWTIAVPATWPAFVKIIDFLRYRFRERYSRHVVRGTTAGISKPVDGTKRFIGRDDDSRIRLTHSYVHCTCTHAVHVNRIVSHRLNSIIFSPSRETPEPIARIWFA